MDHVLLADAKQYAFTLEKSTILPFVSYNASKRTQFAPEMRTIWRTVLCKVIKIPSGTRGDHKNQSISRSSPLQ